jgi:Ras-related protein Rab-1A
MSQKDPEYIFKVLLIGDVGIGKTSLILRYIDNIFNDQGENTITADMKEKTLSLSGKDVKLQIWDTAGQERFRTITSSYYRGANGIMVVYDSTNRETFESVSRLWMEELQRYATEDCSKLIVATKIDLTDQRVITAAEGKELAESMNLPFCETSSKKADGVEAAFRQLIKDMIEAKGGNVDFPRSGTVLLTQGSQPPKTKKKCVI